MPAISIYITFPSKAEASRICSELLDEKLIACANISQVESLYRWKGEMVSEPEWVAVCKSIQNLWPRIEKRTVHLHPYEIPCIVSHPLICHPAYEAWIEREVSEALTQ